MGFCIVCTLLIVFICILIITKSMFNCIYIYRYIFVRDIMILGSVLVLICNYIQC